MSLALDPTATALVLIDLQNGILGMPLAPHGVATVLGNSVALGHRFKAAGSLIVLVNVAFAADGADRLKQPVDAGSPVATPPGGPPAGYSDFPPDIAALGADIVVTKRQWGAFHGTELDLQLRRRGIATIVLGGIATNFGVEQTAREAYQLGYAVILAEDATTSLGADLHQFAIDRIFPRIARVRPTAEIIAALPAA